MEENVATGEEEQKKSRERKAARVGNPDGGLVEKSGALGREEEDEVVEGV